LKKYIVLAFIVMGLLAPSVISISVPEKNIVITNNDFTHTVFAEYGTTTICPYCPPTSENLYNISKSGDYQFYFVSLVANENYAAGTRLTFLKARAVPVAYFDGGYTNIVGAQNETVYRQEIEQMGARNTKRNLDVNVEVTWQGNAKIKVTVDIKNNDDKFYFGILKAYVTEIESRWLNTDGLPYHYALLDFAFNRPILLFPEQTKTISKVWDGNKNRNGVVFDDITEENIMVISTVSHWLPMVEKGYGDQTYLAFVVDQTAGATII